MKAALACLFIALWVSPSAHAVYLNPEGHGQALIFPYFTVQSAATGAFNTYLSIANRSFEGKALRVRVREGRNGRETASFNLFLGRQDMWTGTMIVGPDGSTWLATTDTSCTDPPFTSQSSFPDRLALSNAGFTGANADAYGNDAERLREGYVEVFEMATLPVPATACANLRLTPAASALRPPSGQLTGTLTLINVADGTDFTVNAEALADLATQPYFRPPADPYPDWNITEIDRVATFVSDGTLYRFPTTRALDAVDLALTRATVMSEVVLDEPIAAATDWVLTFPTLRLHSTSGPFIFDSPRELRFALRFADREGAELLLVPDGCGFICPSSYFPANLRLRSLANVLSFQTGTTASAAAGTSRVLASRNAWVATLPTASRNGQAQVLLAINQPPGIVASGTGTRLSDGVVTQVNRRVSGQPVAGFMVRSFRNGNLACGATVCQGNYGGALPYTYTRFLGP